MLPQTLFFVTVAFSFIVWGIVTAQYIWPELRGRQRAEALRPLLILNSFRFMGLAFLVPGVVSPDLPAAFARPTAYGDLMAAVFALVSLLALPRRVGFVLAWVFNLWGTADLLNAIYQANRSGLLPGQLRTLYFIPSVVVPLFLIMHGLVFRILLQHKKDSKPGTSASRITAS
jgi:hypothetical protein